MWPPLFYFTDPKVADAVAPYLYERGAVVIADPAHLPKDANKFTDLLCTIGAPEGNTIPLTIHKVEWTTDIDWDPEFPEDTAAAAYGIATAPGDVFDGADLTDLPRHVIEWMGLDDDED